MCALAGSKDQARQLAEGIRPASGAELPMMAGVAEILALSGATDQAGRIVQSFQLLSPQTAISRFRQALLTVALGDGDGALALVTQSVNDREAEAVWLGVDPRFDSLRERPAFQELVPRVFPEIADREPS